MLGPDKELKILRRSRLMQVTEFQVMVNSLHRFKEELAVKALTGRKNIRNQKTQDRVFFSVLEKMLLEVSINSSSSAESISAAQQQLFALQKVYLWFQSNKHVLLKSDGYFQSARKISEEIHEKKIKTMVRNKTKFKAAISNKHQPNAMIKTIAGHLKQLQELQQEAASSKDFVSGSSMFAPSPTQDLTSIDSATLHDKGNYQEEMDFAREMIDHEHFGGNRIERLNRPMTAPPRLKPYAKSSTEQDTSSRERDMTLQLGLKPATKARPQSAIQDVKHELSWAKISPTPLTQLLHKQEEAQHDISDPNVKKINIVLPSESASDPSTSKRTEIITDPQRIANLVMFKEYCLQHATQQEAFMRQYVHHKHATRQHFLEFPENATESVVRRTATDLHRREPARCHEKSDHNEMTVFNEMSLEEFLDRDVPATMTDNELRPTGGESARSVSAPARLVGAIRSLDCRTPIEKRKPSKIFPHPPLDKMTIVQPANADVKVASMFGVAEYAGKQMNNIKDQVLSAPQHGWRYPMISITSPIQETLPKCASGMVLALHDGDNLQHKVLIPLNQASGPQTDQDSQADETNYEELMRPVLSKTPNAESARVSPVRPISAKSTFSNVVSPRPSTRPQSNPRFITGVSAVYRQSNYPNIADRDTYEEYAQHQRSIGASRGTSRPRTAASWGSYPAQSEVSKSMGAASHHSTGTLRHRSVAESMRVRSVAKKNVRVNSGRSSASSYVAQLRAKQRTGGNLPVRPPGGMKKTRHVPQPPPPPEVAVPLPQISFMNIVAPMHVPSDLETTAYAPPGGVYCGTTAAVALAADKRYDPNSFEYDIEDALSLEDYNSLAKEKDSAAASDTGEDNWLSHWLSGGPLEGLQGKSHNKGGATTYADLISRAANLDSSDERSYSDERLSSTNANAIAERSPRDDIEFSISARSDQLVSHRQEEPEENIDVLLADFGDIPTKDPVSPESTSLRSTMSPISTRGLSSEDDVESAEENVTEEQEKDQPKQQMDGHNLEEHVLDDKIRDDADFNAKQDVMVGDEIQEESDKGSERIDISTEKDVDHSAEMQEKESTNKTNVHEENYSGKSDLKKANEEVDSPAQDNQESERFEDNKEDNLTETQQDGAGVSEIDHCSSEQKFMSTTDEQLDADTGDEIIDQSETVLYVDERQPEINSNDFENKSSNENDETNLQGESQHVADQTDDFATNETKGDDQKSGGWEPEEEGSSSERSSYVSQSESEREYSIEKCGLKIVITSARRVERQLAECKELMREDAIAEEDDESKVSVQMRKGTKMQNSEKAELVSNENDIELQQTSPDKRHEIIENVKLTEDKQGHDLNEGSVIEEGEEEGTQKYKISHLDEAGITLPPAPIEEQIVHDYQETTVEIQSVAPQLDESSRIITFEEISAVDSLSRPASGRPIPVEGEVRDPFVEMVSSTRHKQIQRGVDVQAIFNSQENCDSVCEPDSMEQKAHENEKEAAVKMQRAYRGHLARTKAARKCSGLSPESLEWAKSYKAMLQGKKERRKERLRESNSHLRAAKRREQRRLNHVGPHNVVYEVFHPEPDLPDRELIQESALEIQRHARGWFVRRKMAGLQMKVEKYGTDLKTAVAEYRNVLRKTQERHGKMKPSMSLNFDEFSSYWDQRCKYERIFKKREFWNEMESSDLRAFFTDCELYPSQIEIDEAWDSARKSRDLARRQKKTRSKTAMTLDDVIDVAFYIYTPIGARLGDTRKSTWMNPVVAGLEGIKLEGFKDQEESNKDVKTTDINAVNKLVTGSNQERKEGD